MAVATDRANAVTARLQALLMGASGRFEAGSLPAARPLTDLPPWLEMGYFYDPEIYTVQAQGGEMSVFVPQDPQRVALLIGSSATGSPGFVSTSPVYSGYGLPVPSATTGLHLDVQRHGILCQWAWYAGCQQGEVQLFAVAARLRQWPEGGQ